MTPRNRRPATTKAEFLVAPEDLEPDPETGPLRRCAVTRERRPKESMIRFVLSPERMVVPDLAARLPGRGIWLSAQGNVLEAARAQGSLARAFARIVPQDAAEADVGRVAAKPGRGPVTLPPDLSGLIEAMLVRRIVELLGLARRAAQAVCGFQKAREWLISGRVGLVLQASDGSADERARFLSGVTPRDAAGSVSGPDERVPSGAVPVGAPLSAASLGAVFGRDHVVHVVVAPGRLAEALTNEIARLAGVTCRAGSGRKDAKAGPKAAGDNAGKTEIGQIGTGQTGPNHDVNKRAGA